MMTATNNRRNVQWNARLPISRRNPFSAATAAPSRSTSTRNRLRRKTFDALAATAAGGAVTRRSTNEGNASSSLAWMGRARAERQSARERGSRHAISDTNSNAVISPNHHDPNTSKKPAAEKNVPQNG